MPDPMCSDRRALGAGSRPSTRRNNRPFVTSAGVAVITQDGDARARARAPLGARAAERRPLLGARPFGARAGGTNIGAHQRARRMPQGEDRAEAVRTVRASAAMTDAAGRKDAVRPRQRAVGARWTRTWGGSRRLEPSRPGMNGCAVNEAAPGSRDAGASTPWKERPSAPAVDGETTMGNGSAFRFRRSPPPTRSGQHAVVDPSNQIWTTGPPEAERAGSMTCSTGLRRRPVPPARRRIDHDAAGLDMGPSTIAAVGKNGACPEPFCDEAGRAHRAIRRRRRTLDRRRRGDNPDAYPSDGRVTPGRSNG